MPEIQLADVCVHCTCTCICACSCARRVVAQGPLGGAHRWRMPRQQSGPPFPWRRFGDGVDSPIVQTHENLEHLAMMEAVVGHLPEALGRQASRDAEKYFRCAQTAPHHPFPPAAPRLPPWKAASNRPHPGCCG